MDPQTLTALISMLGQQGSSGSSIPLDLNIKQPAAAPSPYNVFTPEMAQQAFDYYQNYGNTLNQLYGTPSYGPGGASVKQAQEMSPQEVKSEEYIKYLVSKGYTPENAQKEANAIVSSKKRKFTDDKGFKDYIRAGSAEGLKTRDGRIQAETRFTPGGASVSPGSEALNQALQGLSMQSVQAASGLPQLYAQDAQRALAQKAGLSNMLGGYLQQGFNQQGLLPSEQANLDALKAKYLQDFQSLNKNNLQQTVGQLTGTGFNSSNLAGKALQSGVYDANSRFLTDAMAALAGQESNLLAQRAGIQGQNITNLLNAFNSLGANQGIGSVLGGVLNPAQAGLFTDPQSLALAAQLQQQNIGNRMQQQQLEGSVLQQPVTMMPQAPSSGGGLMSSLAPIIGGIAGSVIPGVGTMVGSAIGGAIGGLTKK